MRLPNIVIRPLCAAALALSTGCALYQRVGVESQPAGAQVFLDGELVGQTPLMLRIGREADHLVFLKLDGYVPERAILTLNREQDRVDFLTPADVVVRLQPRLGAPRAIDPVTGKPVPRPGEQRDLEIKADTPDEPSEPAQLPSQGRDPAPERRSPTPSGGLEPR